MAAFRKQVRALQCGKRHTSTLHFPHLVTAILEHVHFPIVSNEMKDTVVRHFTPTMWTHIYNSRKNAAKKPHTIDGTVQKKPRISVKHAARAFARRDAVVISDDEAEDEDEDDDDEAAEDDSEDEDTLEEEEVESSESDSAVAATTRRSARTQHDSTQQRVQRPPAPDSSIDYGSRFDQLQTVQSAMRQDITSLQHSQFQIYQMTSYTSQLMEMICLGQKPTPDFLEALRLSREQPFGGQYFPSTQQPQEEAGMSCSRGKTTHEEDEDADMD